MNKKNIKKWVAALRSGKYKQGAFTLHRKNKFCCLGVACELYQREVGGLEIKKEIKEFLVDDGYREDICVCYDGDSYLLPNKVRNWLDLSYPFQNGLASMNDEGKSFEEIANYLDKELVQNG